MYHCPDVARVVHKHARVPDVAGNADGLHLFDKNVLPISCGITGAVKIKGLTPELDI